MDRTEIFDLMSQLKLYGMKVAFDEIMATALKRKHEPANVVGDLLKAEIAEKQARSIKYQLTIAKFPLPKDLSDFVFDLLPELPAQTVDGHFYCAFVQAELVSGFGLRNVFGVPTQPHLENFEMFDRPGVPVLFCQRQESAFQ